MSSVTGRVLLLTLAGVAAGLLTWFFSDLSGFIHLPDTGGRLTPNENLQQVIVCTVFGALIALLLGAADGMSTGSRAEWGKIVGIGLLIGSAAGFTGIQFGMPFYGFLHTEVVTNPFSFVRNLIARAIGWAFIGALAGTADGIRKWNGRIIRNGMIGGFLGGLFGGTAFETSIYILPFLRSPAVVSRLLGFVITGALIGLFIALVQQLLKEAWIKVIVGKNEGKEFLVEKQQTTIGRSELSDIPLYGDMAVAKNHAVLYSPEANRFVLRDVSNVAGSVRVNGEPIGNEAERLIKSGDQIQIGGKLMVFYERLTKERTAPAAKDVKRPTAAPPMPAPNLTSMPPMAPASPMGLGALPHAGTNGMASAGDKRLVVTAGPHAGMTFPVRPGARIGRDPNIESALPSDGNASRQHARIVQEALSFAIEDTGSTNGTYVNGQRVTRQTLLPGDTVVVGNTSLRLE